MKTIEETKGLYLDAVKLCHENNEKCNSFVTIIDKPETFDVKDNALKDVPYTAKDLFSTKDILTTGSSNTLKNYIPIFNATVIDKLNEKGAVLVGKTACDEFGLGGSGTTCATGAVKNPFDEERIAGGSSAGAAASVASGAVAFALGTDTGDSVRKPAAYCGIVGYKPTYGLISRYGVFPFAASLDHVGIFTTSVKDVVTVTDAIKGQDNKDMTSIYTPNLGFNFNGNAKGKRLCYIKELFDLKPYETDNETTRKIMKNLARTKEIIKSLGIDLVEESIPKEVLDAIYPTYMVISCAEATSNLSMYTGISYGERINGKTINETIKNFRSTNFSSLIKRRLVIGSFVLQKENQEKYYLNACKARRLINKTFGNLLDKYDGFIGVASGQIAPLIKDANDKMSGNKPIENYLAFANLGGYPSITIPNGKVDNMPVGINITGKLFDDITILNIAYALERAGINE